MTTTTEDSNLVRHAEREMRLAGLYDHDADYDGMIPEAVLSVVRTFTEAGHSGFSAMLVTSILEKVLRFQTLTPITSDPEHWMSVSDLDSGGELWQSTRDPSVFSEDGGQTWYSLDREWKVGDRVEDGGVMGTIVRCEMCGGSGQLHDPDERPEPVEPLAVWVCRACHYGHFNECEDERCQSTRLEDRHE